LQRKRPNVVAAVSFILPNVVVFRVKFVFNNSNILNARAVGALYATNRR
jgi:hypothetical protein